MELTAVVKEHIQVTEETTAYLEWAKPVIKQLAISEGRPTYRN
jgi:hypothetical protein